MRIDPQKLTATVAAGSAPTAAAPGAGKGSQPREATPSRADGVDRVQLSPLTDRVRGILEAGRSQQESRVERLAQQFQAGRSSSDAGATSRALVRETLAGSAAGTAKP